MIVFNKFYHNNTHLLEVITIRHNIKTTRIVSLNCLRKHDNIFTVEDRYIKKKQYPLYISSVTPVLDNR